MSYNNYAVVIIIIIIIIALRLHILCIIIEQFHLDIATIYPLQYNDFYHRL